MRVKVTDTTGIPDRLPFGAPEFARMGEAAAVDLRRRAPVDTGALKASIRAVPTSDGVAVEALEYASRQKALQDPDPAPVDRVVGRVIDEWLAGDALDVLDDWSGT